MFRTVTGLQVAYLSGRFDKNEYQKKHDNKDTLVSKRERERSN